MAATREMLNIALEVQPHTVTLVPEKDRSSQPRAASMWSPCKGNSKAPSSPSRKKGLKSVFVEADEQQLEACKALHVDAVELHTGTYYDAQPWRQPAELERLKDGSKFASGLGLEVVAGHGLHYRNVQAVAAIPEIVELNIGHAIIAHAAFVGLKDAVAEMARCIRDGRQG